MSDNIPRQPAGSPQGGQFAATGHAEADVSLAPSTERNLAEARALIARMSAGERLVLQQDLAQMETEEDVRDIPKPAPWPADLPDPEVSFSWEDGDVPDMTLTFGDGDDDYLTVYSPTAIGWGDFGDDSPGENVQHREAIERFARQAYERGDRLRQIGEFRHFANINAQMDRIAAETGEAR